MVQLPCSHTSVWECPAEDSLGDGTGWCVGNLNLTVFQHEGYIWILFKVIVKDETNPLESIWKVIGKRQITHNCMAFLLLSSKHQTFQLPQKISKTNVETRKTYKCFPSTIAQLSSPCVLKRKMRTKKPLLRERMAPQCGISKTRERQNSKLQNDLMLWFTGSWVAAGKDRGISAGKYPIYTITKLRVTDSHT